MASTNLFAKRVGLLVAGTAGAQAIALSAAPLLTRLYTPDDFGLLAVFGAFLAVITLVASLRYELAIPISASDREAAHIVVLCLLANIVMAAASGALFFFFGTAIAALLNAEALFGYFWLIPVGVLIAGVYQIFNHWAIRTKSFRTIATTKWTQAVAMIGVQLAGYKMGGIALLMGQMAGQGGGGARLACAALHAREFRSITVRGVREAARRYLRFPLFSTWSGLMNTVSAQLPAVVFAGAFGPAGAGLYLLTYRVLVTPTSLVGGAVGNVFFSQASEAHRNGTLGALVGGVYGKLTHLALGPALVVVAAGPALFEIVFGSDWRLCGELARWMVPWILLAFIYSPLSTLFDVLEKQALEAALQAALLAVRVAAMVAGTLSGDIVLTVALYSGSSALVYLISLVVVTRLSGSPALSFALPMISGLGWGALVTLPIAVANFYSPSAPWWILAAVLSVCLIGYHYKRLYQSETVAERAA